MVARPWSSSRLSCGEGLLLSCDGNTENFLQNTQGKDPFSRASRQKRGSSGCGRTLVLPLKWRQYVGEHLELQPGCEALFGSSRD